MKDSAVLDRPAMELTQRHEAAVHHVLDVLQRFLAPLGTDELNELAQGLQRSLAQEAVSQEKANLARTLAGRDFGPSERVGLEQWALMEHFRHREQLLEGALTATQVANLLGTTRQAPYDRAKRGGLLAVMDRGALRFPPWQFDPADDNGVVPGLPEVVRTLGVSPLGKISWMVRSNPYLEGATPLECLRAGQVERVVALARGVERT